MNLENFIADFFINFDNQLLVGPVTPVSSLLIILFVELIIRVDPFCDNKINQSDHKIMDHNLRLWELGS